MGAFALILFTAAAAVALLSSATAGGMKRTDAAWGPENTGRDISGLVHAINGYQVFRHTNPHMNGCRPIAAKASAAPGWNKVPSAVGMRREGRRPLPERAF